MIYPRHSGFHARQQLHQQPNTENDCHKNIGLIHRRKAATDILALFKQIYKYKSTVPHPLPGFIRDPRELRRPPHTEEMNPRNSWGFY